MEENPPKRCFTQPGWIWRSITFFYWKKLQDKGLEAAMSFCWASDLVKPFSIGTEDPTCANHVDDTCSLSDSCFPSNVHTNILRGLLCRLESLRLKFTIVPSIFVDGDLAESIKRSASDRLGHWVPQVSARTSPGFFTTWCLWAFVLSFLSIYYTVVPRICKESVTFNFSPFIDEDNKKKNHNEIGVKMKTVEAKPFDQNAENWKRENRLFTSNVLEAGASGQNQIGNQAGLAMARGLGHTFGCRDHCFFFFFFWQQPVSAAPGRHICTKVRGCSQSQQIEERSRMR